LKPRPAPLILVVLYPWPFPDCDVDATVKRTLWARAVKKRLDKRVDINIIGA
jgi:hypothetical protein